MLKYKFKGESNFYKQPQCSVKFKLRLYKYRNFHDKRIDHYGFANLVHIEKR